ncbi:MAG: GIY-YIG nuclease family protein [Minisyncoccia bacterium]
MSSSEKINQNIAKLPDSPGVYIFKSKTTVGSRASKLDNGRILYIGKATSLRDRVRSYFRPDIVDTRSPLISKMLSQFETIDHIKTDSVLEALILEAHLIKKYQPEANVAQKDNKSFNFVVITKEDFPRVLTVRSRELLKNNPYDIAHSFGPFPNGGQLKEALKLVRKLFPFRDKCVPCEVLTKQGVRVSATASPKATQCRACFNRQIGLCPGVCSGETSKEDYGKQIQNIVLFFEGRKKELLKSLEKKMKALAKEKDFEGAGKVKKTLFALNHIQDVSLIKDDFRKNSGLDSQDTFRIESYDIAHMSGQNVVGVMTVVEDGEVNKSEYRKFKIKEDPGVNDTKALKEVLERRLGHNEWKYPNLVVVDGGRAQKIAMESVLKKYGIEIPVVSVVKDERHKAREILGDKKYLKYEKEIILSNAEAHKYAIGFHKQLRRKLF